MLAVAGCSQVEALADETGAVPVSVDEILFREVDVVSPNALGGIIKPYSGDVMAPFLPTGPDSYDLWTVGNLWS